MESIMVGIDIGGTKCAVTTGSWNESSITINKKEKFSTPKLTSPKLVLTQIAETIRSLTADSVISSIGISCGGPLDSRNGIILSPPNLPGWDHVDITHFFEQIFSVPVFLENDANACALAEWKFGAGKGFRNVIFLTFGTGLGAGLILDGRLYRGTNDMAGEVGHIRLSEHGPIGFGKSGSFEGFCSGGGIAQLGRIKATEALQMGKNVSYCQSLSDLDSINAKTIADQADAGHEDAKEVYRICGEKLGYGLSILTDLLNPERIILGSIYQRSENLLFDAMDRVMEKECLSYARQVCKVVPSGLKEQIGDYAALAVACNGRN